MLRAGDRIVAEMYYIMCILWVRDVHTEMVVSFGIFDPLDMAAAAKSTPQPTDGRTDEQNADLIFCIPRACV